MIYVSIDIETSGLDPYLDQVLEIGAMATELGSEYEIIDSYHAIIQYDRVQGSPYALAMNERLLTTMAKGCDDCMTLAMARTTFRQWLENFYVTGNQVTAAGKNFEHFDLPFLLEEDIVEKGCFHRRVLDPAVLYARADDEVPPNLVQCLDRAGLSPTQGVSSHYALGDCLDVIRVISAAYSERSK